MKSIRISGEGLVFTAMLTACGGGGNPGDTAPTSRGTLIEPATVIATLTSAQISPDCGCGAVWQDSQAGTN